MAGPRGLLTATRLVPQNGVTVSGHLTTVTRDYPRMNPDIGIWEIDQSSRAGTKLPLSERV